MSKRNKQIRLAQALKVEIENARELQVIHLNGSQPTMLEKARSNGRRFVVWYDAASYTIYQNAGEAIRLLPESCVRNVISFYTVDSTLRANVSVLATNNYDLLTPEEREAHINEIFETLNGTCTSKFFEAVKSLDKVINSRRLIL